MTTRSDSRANPMGTGMHAQLPALIERLLAQAGRQPETVLRFVARDGAETAVCAGDFVGEAFGLLAALRGAGLRPGSVAAIRGTGGSHDFALSILAAALGGISCVPLVSLLGDGDVEVILDLCRADALLCETRGPRHDVRPHLDYLARTRPGLLVVDLSNDTILPGGSELSRAHRDPTPSPQPPGALAGFVLFTSGTTSVPKGAMHSYNTVLAEVYDFADQLSLLDRGHLLQPFPLGHIGGIAGLFIGLLLGREITLLASWDAAVAFDVIERHKVTAMGSTPFFAQTLLDERELRGAGLSSLTTMESGGGRVGSDLVRRAAKFGIPVSRAYGSTEHPTVTSHHRTDPLDVRADSDGRPLNGSEVRILDEARRPLPTGVDGEVATRGPEQFLGYLSGDDSQFTPDGWFCTGDVGHLTENGHLRITGRKKEIIIRGGENISISEVEECLNRHPDVEDAAVIAVPDARFGERVYAFVVRCTGHHPVDLESVRAHFGSLGVSRFKTPEGVEEVAMLPRNALGKLQRHQLKPAHPVLGSSG